MAIIRNEPYSNAYFRVEIPIIPDSLSFDEVLLPDLLLEVEEYREGSDPSRVSRKLPGMRKFTNLVLRRGFDGRLELYQWWKMTAEGRSSDYRLTVIVSLLNEEHTPAVRWILRNAFPVSYTFTPLDSLDGSPIIETLEVCCESVEME